LGANFNTSVETMVLPSFRSCILGIIRGIPGLVSLAGLEVRGGEHNMKQPATKLAYGVAILVLSFKTSLQDEIPVSVGMTWQRQK
jgi:hypothetical protein